MHIKRAMCEDKVLNIAQFIGTAFLNKLNLFGRFEELNTALST